MLMLFGVSHINTVPMDFIIISPILMPTEKEIVIYFQLIII